MIEHIRIVDITNDVERITQSQLQNSEEWRGGLTLEQHVEREQALDQLLAAEGMPMRRWAMETRVSEQGCWEMVCSLEALKRPAYVKIKSCRPRNAVNYVLDAVYTPKEHRGKGYARRLVQEVCSQLANETNDGPVLISLWSDVGDWYKRCGFKPAPRPATEIVAESNGAMKWPIESDDYCLPLGLEESRASIAYGRAIMLSAIDLMTEKDQRPRAIVAPTSGILKQMQWRTEWICSVLGLEQPRVYGARTSNGWTAWSYQMAEHTLYILAISGPLLEMVTLFQAALAAAQPMGFKVIMYEADLVFVDQPITGLFMDALRYAGVQCEFRERTDSLPYYLAVGPDHGDGEMQLEFAGKYSWF